MNNLRKELQSQMELIGFAFAWGDGEGESIDGRHPIFLHHADILFGHSAHSLFKYHQDLGSHITAIVQVSPGEDLSDFHIAGASKAASYFKSGSCHIFPSAMYHRSGRSTIGTVKIAFFFHLMKRPLVQDLDAAEPASSSVQEQDNVERAESESS